MPKKLKKHPGDPGFEEYIRNLVFVQGHYEFFNFLDLDSEPIQNALVKKSVNFYNAIPNPTKTTKLLAIGGGCDNWKSILANGADEEIKIAIIKRFSGSFRYIKNPTEEMKSEAVKRYWREIEYIKNPSEELQLLALQYDYNAIQLIKNPTKKVQICAVKGNASTIAFIENPCKKAIAIAAKKGYIRFELIDKFPALHLFIVKRNVEHARKIAVLSQEAQEYLVNLGVDYFVYINRPSEKTKQLILEKV